MAVVAVMGEVAAAVVVAVVAMMGEVAAAVVVAVVVAVAATVAATYPDGDRQGIPMRGNVASCGWVAND